MFIWEVIADHPAQGRKQGDREGKQDRKVCVLLQTEPEHTSPPHPGGEGAAFVRGVDAGECLRPSQRGQLASEFLLLLHAHWPMLWVRATGL